MKAIIIKNTGEIGKRKDLLEFADIPVPSVSDCQILIKVSACGVCHTELDEIEGRIKLALPVVPGHQVVGKVEETGKNVTKFRKGDRAGVAWIFSSCGKCMHCSHGYENLCEDFQATGCHRNGGYAEYMAVHEDFAYHIPDRFGDSQAAPLLCAGVIGFRSLRLANMENRHTLGLYGFGASAHIVIQIAKHVYPDSRIFVFTRPGQKDHQELAGKLGADWVGATGDTPPEKLHRAIDFTPAGIPVKEALRNLHRGGRLVINAIRKITPIPELDYNEHLWHEKEIKSVANVTRKDAADFLPLAAEIPVIPEITVFPLCDAEKALIELKHGRIQGAAVLICK
jgi:propanol-preferring alcohol dehydrogenase